MTFDIRHAICDTLGGGKGSELFNYMFSFQLHHKITLKSVFKFCVMPEHSIIVLKITSLPYLTPVQTKKI